MNCFLGFFHDWSQWEEFQQKTIVRRLKLWEHQFMDPDTATIGTQFRQKRQCKKCGLTQYKSKNIYIND